MVDWDVAVIGGGVIGAAIAYELGTVSAVGTVVVDDPLAGSAASPAAVGLIVAGGLHARPGFWLSLRECSAALWPEWIAGVEEYAGTSATYHRGSVYHLALSAEEAASWQRQVAQRREAGLDAQWICGSQLALPGAASLSAAVVGAARFALDAFVEGGCFQKSLRAACRSLGVAWKEGRVTDLNLRPSGVWLRLSSGEEVSARSAVLAAGMGSRSLLAPLGVTLPLLGIQGERLRIRLRDLVQASPQGFSTTRGALLLHGSELVVGGNTNKLSAPTYVTTEGARRLLDLARSVWSDSTKGEVIEAKAGLRPCSQLRHPLIGFLDESKRLMVATGHHRSGILWAPLTARLVRQALLGEESTVPLAAFAW